MRDGSNSASANIRGEHLVSETVWIGVFITIDPVCSQQHPDFIPVAITIHLAFLFGFIVSCKEPRLNYPISALEGKLLIFSISHPNAVILIATFQALLQMLTLSYHLFILPLQSF